MSTCPHHAWGCLKAGQAGFLGRGFSKVPQAKDFRTPGSWAGPLGEVAVSWVPIGLLCYLQN